jgi:uncharacterized protein YeeX (DUF496 family)
MKDKMKKIRDIAKTMNVLKKLNPTIQSSTVKDAIMVNFQKMKQFEALDDEHKAKALAIIEEEFEKNPTFTLTTMKKLFGKIEDRLRKEV